jgi:hypothetical protein
MAVAGLAALSLVATSGGVVNAAPGDAAVFENTVFAATYVSTGASSSTVNGDVVAGTYLTLGADSMITGTADSGGIATLGASAQVQGLLNSPGNVIGAGAQAAPGSGSAAYAPGFATPAAELATAQSDLNAMGVDYFETFGNEATGANYPTGVYNVNGLQTYTANTTITLDPGTDCNDFVFNADSYITFGAGVNVVMATNSCATVPQVFWNAGGYISIGAGANIIGTVIAKTYVSVGATATVQGADGECGGGVYSQSSYVSIGAGAVVSGGGSCTPVDCTTTDTCPVEDCTTTDTCPVEECDLGLTILTEWDEVLGADVPTYIIDNCTGVKVEA